MFFDAINDSLPEWKDHFGTYPRKIGADEYWDDKAIVVKNGSLNITGSEKLSIEELKEMNGEPVWCADVSHWCLVEVDGDGMWEGVPFILWYDNGATFTWNVSDRELSCYRNKVVS